MEMLKVAEAAKIMGIQNYSVCHAIRKKKLNGVKNRQGEYLIRRDDIEEYMRSKYDRSHSKFDGKLKFDKEKGEYSLSEGAKYLGVVKNLLYYLARTEKLRYSRKGSSYVVSIEELDRIRKIYLDT